MNWENNNDILEKSINDLDGKCMSEKSEFNSFTVDRTFELMDKRIRLLQPEDIRLLIGQNIGLKYLVPIAIEILTNNPLIDAEYFEGDLLLRLLSIDENFWKNYPDLKLKFLEIFNNDSIDYDSLSEETKNEILQLYNEFDNVSD